MGAGLQEQDSQKVIVLLPNHKPVGLDMAFPNFSLLVHEFVGAVLLRQFASICKQINGILNQFDVQASFHAAFQVLIETVGIVNLVHSLKFA